MRTQWDKQIESGEPVAIVHAEFGYLMESTTTHSKDAADAGKFTYKLARSIIHKKGIHYYMMPYHYRSAL